MRLPPARLIAILFPVALTLAAAGSASAWNASGYVYCDANQDRTVDQLDLPLEGVIVDIESTTGPFTASVTTDAAGRFFTSLPDFPDSYRESLDETTLPSDATFVDPPTNEHLFTTSEFTAPDVRNWLIDSATCREGDAVGCRVTGGGNDTAGIDAAGGWDGTLAEGKSRRQGNSFNRYTFGGQAGANTGQQPQPKGEWTHHQQSGPDGSFLFHAGTASAPAGTEIDVIVCSDEGYCSPARPAPNKQIDFAGIGTFRNIKNPSAALANVVPGDTYHWFEVHIEDLGEPGNESPSNGKPKNNQCVNGGSGTDAFANPPIFLDANCGCADFYRIRIYQGVTPAFDPVTGEVTNINKTNVIYEVAGYIDGGNLQIHPPTGFDLK